MDAYSSDSAEDSENEHTRRGRLGHRATERFETILRGLTSTREKIARGMAFALEHADAANTVRLSITCSFDDMPSVYLLGRRPTNGFIDPACYSRSAKNCSTTPSLRHTP